MIRDYQSINTTQVQNQRSNNQQEQFKNRLVYIYDHSHIYKSSMNFKKSIS